MDELAVLAGADPVAFRLRHLTDPRAIDVVSRATQAAKWRAPHFFDPALVRSAPTTDLLTTLHIAAEHFQDADGRDKELLYPVGHAPIDVTLRVRRSAPHAARRLDCRPIEAEPATLAEGTCIIVIGADHTTPAGQRVRGFWADYFASAGGKLAAENYRLRPPTDVVDC